MKVFVVVSALLAVGAAAPSYGVAGLHAAAVVPAGPAVATVAESYHAGPAVAQTYVQHGVVGHKTVKVGSQPVQVGHEYFVADQQVHQPAPYSFVAGEPINTAQTVALPPPALPVAAPAPYAAIPPAPVNYGPAPADTVTQEKILAPVRTHTRITPQVTRVEPTLTVNPRPYDVPVAEPFPVHRDVIVQKPVQKPYTVEVPRPVAVPAPYKVHPVHEVVETPVVREHTVSVHAPAVAVHQVGYAHAAAPVAVEGYAAAAPAYGYANQLVAAAPAYGYANQVVAADGYAALA